MDRAKERLDERKRRAVRVRKKVTGTAERPRLCVRRSLKHISAQIVDDTTGRSLLQVTSTAKEIASKVADGKGKGGKTAVSKLVGGALGALAKERGIQKVVFDRKGYRYHGRVKALADAAREAGLVF